MLEAAEVLDTLTPFRRETSPEPDGPSDRPASDLPEAAPEAELPDPNVSSDPKPPADDAQTAPRGAREPKDDP